MGISYAASIYGGCMVLAMASATPARAAPPVSFHEAVDMAWERLPQRRNLDARRRVAEAHFMAGGTIFPNAPYVTGNYFNDKVAGSNEGYVTTQGEIGTPIWLPGEGTATQNAARADAATIAADEAAEHLALASHMLDLVRRVSLAANAVEVARRQLALATHLSALLHTSVAVGEVAQSDALAADAEAAQARITVSDEAAELAATQASLQILTGSDAIPVLAAPPAPASVSMLAAAVAITPDVAQAIAAHPAIQAAERAREAANARARLVRIENRDDPEVGLQVINEKQYGSPWDTRVGVMVHFPFATAGRNAPRRAQAEADITQADVRLDQTQRDVLTGIRQAAAHLAGAEQANDAGLQAAAALDRRRAQIDHAWRLGEMPLIELIRANATAFDADLTAAKARTERAAARLALRIALGEVP